MWQSLCSFADCPFCYIPVRTKTLCKWAQLHQSDAFSCSQPMWDVHSSHTTCVSPVVPHWNCPSSSTWMMFPSCQPDGKFLPSLAMRRDQMLLNRFIPCLSCKHLGYKRASTQTCLFPASRLPAVLVRRWAESMNDLLLPAEFSAVCTSCSSLNCCSSFSLALKCPDRWCNPELTYGTLSLHDFDFPLPLV